MRKQKNSKDMDMKMQQVLFLHSNRYQEVRGNFGICKRFYINYLHIKRQKGNVTDS